MRFVSPGHGSSLEAWMAMGSPPLPSLSQIKELIAASALPAVEASPINHPIVLGPQTLAVVEIER
jgi:hypothetical protein